MALSTEQLLARIPTGVLTAGTNLLYGLPRPLKRLLAGKPFTRDGQLLDLDMQLLLRVEQLAGIEMGGGADIAAARTLLRAANQLVAGKSLQPVAARELRIPLAEATIGARLYTPDGLAPGSGLLVFYHGGGWVLGDMDTHDTTCRTLAAQAGVRVLSVHYRMAPEHRFPTAAQDAVAAYRYAAANAADLGADPALIAVGGDSAGGNLAAVVSHLATREDGPAPAFQLLFYPATDATVRRRSRELFADGLFLTDAAIDWFLGHYVPDHGQRADPRLSVLLAEDLSGLPAAYIATAGFDPLRDEGEAYAQRLAAAGVPVSHHRQRDLIHGYVNFLAAGPRPRQALAEAAGALRTGLALRGRP